MPFILALLLAPKRVTAPSWPFCPRCVRLHTGRMVTGLILMALAVTATAVAWFAVPGDSSAFGGVLLASVVVFLVGVGFVRRGTWGSVARGRVIKDVVDFRRTHPRFAELAGAAREPAAAPAQVQPYPVQRGGQPGYALEQDTPQNR